MSKKNEEQSVPRDLIDPGYAFSMKDKGFNWNTLASIRKVRCPTMWFHVLPYLCKDDRLQRMSDGNEELPKGQMCKVRP